MDIKIYNGALINDIRGKVYFYANSRAQTEDSEAMLQGLNESGNQDMMQTWIDNAMGEVKATLRHYATVTSIIAEDETDKLYIIGITLPRQNSRELADAVTQLIHEICVNRVFAEWLKINSPAEMAGVEAETAKKTEMLVDAVSTRIRPEKQSLKGTNPFQRDDD